ncbi:MAG: carboxylating nicotinate-nucleotide diphosphorylase [Bacteroidales bacterium]|nr:carboxylating nicotinate-nucleotide diphosphorylase [Bacteroidales bacterium]
MKTKDQLIDELLDLAFAEDLGDGDHTTLSTIPADAMGRSRLIIKEEGVLSGVEIAEKVLHKVDPSIKIDVMIKDGSHVKPGDIAFTAEGPVRSLLIAERTMLNIMQRMSGVATMTARYQKELDGLHTKVLDTRKTTPGMRMLEKEAVAAGGGKNHRIGLYDMILIKDNHIDFAGGIEKAISRANDYCKANGKDLKIEVEVRSLDDIRRVMEHGGVDRIMFDNFSPELTKEAVALVGGKYETESSGGITIENLRAYGEAGVDFISVGALTHSVKGLDMSFKAF